MAQDITSGEMGTIDIRHKKVHAGQAFQGVYTQTVAANTTVQCLLRTPGLASEVLHAVFNISATGAGAFAIYENPSISTTTGQTNVSLRSANRISNTFTSYSTYVATPSSTIVTGTLLDYAVTGTGANILLGDPLRNELILAGNQTYLIQFMNAAGALTNNVAMAVYYYQGGAS